MTKAHSSSRLLITIAGSPIEVSYERVKLESLRLDPENPRIRLQMTVAGRTQELLELMRMQPGYDALQRQIREEGGIYEPLIVRHDGRIVEGNTRYTVLSVLVKTPGGREKWGTVPIMRLPVDVPEKVIQLQLAGYHVSGKTRWRAAAQAGQIYRLIEETKATINEVAVATRMTPKQVQQSIDAYKYLVDEVIPELKDASPTEKQEILETKFSHALEFMKNRNLESVRNDKEARKKVAKVIAEDKIKGAEMRKLHSVLKHPRASGALERHGFEAAKETLRKADPTGESKVLKAIEKLTETLETLDQSDLGLFLAHAKARKALQSLIAAAENVVGLTKGKRNV